MSDEGGSVTARTPSGEAVAEAACTALAPYPWRRFTPQLIARFVVAASDRESLRTTLGTVAGTTVGRWEPLTPAAPDDPRLAPLLTFLASHRWTELRLLALCRNLLDALGPEAG